MAGAFDLGVSFGVPPLFGPEGARPNQMMPMITRITMIMTDMVVFFINTGLTLINYDCFVRSHTIPLLGLFVFWQAGRLGPQAETLDYGGKNAFDRVQIGLVLAVILLD